MSTKPNVLVLTGFGLNCDHETAYAFELAGGRGQTGTHQRPDCRRRVSERLSDPGFWRRLQLGVTIMAPG